ncbi:MAG TPA: helix-turn-helix domain-containing protein [Verrucomicrobiae bacterium]|nr:helix-turn-helix domain-containing protein [Verrucomicrobiae bacterium]
MGAFGEKLRKQREQQGIGLDAISGTTKISTRMLRALEDEHFDQLPGGVFNKGFVRAYARQVGLNEEEAIADYLAAVRENQLRENQSRENQVETHSSSPDVRHRLDHPPSGHDHPGNKTGRQLLTEDRRKQFRRNEDRRNEDRRNEDRRNADHRKEDRRNEAPRQQELSSSPDSATSAAHPPAARFRQKYSAGNPAADSDLNRDPATEIPWGKLAVALLLVTLTLALWNSRRHREPAPAPAPSLTSNQAPAAAPSSAPPSHPGQQPRATTPLKAKAPLAGITSSAKPSSTTISTEPAANTATTPPPNSSPANPTPEESTASAPPAASTNTFSVLIRADETSWVSITADGKPVAHETLIAPAHTSVRASGQVVVKAGNAAGISFELNGKEIPAQGNEGEVKTYVFDAAGFRVLPPGPAPATAR